VRVIRRICFVYRKMRILFFCTLCLATAFAAFPAPFARILRLASPPLKGHDVIIMQNLIARSKFVATYPFTGIFDERTETALKQFQAGEMSSVAVPGVFDDVTANLVMTRYLADGYKEDGKILPGYLYKVHVPVHRNRSIETTATLYDRNMTVLRRYTVRARGQSDSQGRAINQLTGSGETPTGLMSFDLNSPEDDPKSFGPYPVNRAVQGLKGNAGIHWIINSTTVGTLISDIRDGILMHTGQWAGWDATKPMPNSHGCIHCHPPDVEAVWHTLVGLGVKVNPNSFGKLPYPYKPQGLLSVELID